MRIDASESICGISVVQIRDFLRTWRDDAWTLRLVADEFGIREHHASALLGELEKLGFVEQRGGQDWRRDGIVVQGPEQGRSSRVRAWGTTTRGNALAMATTASSVKRVTAERVLREFLDRVRTVNESDSYLYRVERVILFGSMLNKEKDRVNDIDLVLELVPKERDLEKAHQLNMAYANEQVAKGRHYRNYADMLFFAKNDALKFLRKRSRLLNFHNPDDSVWADSPHRTIYENG